MAQTGSIDGDDVAERQIKAAKLLWTDEELAASVEVYVYMLRLERAGIAYSRAAISATLRAGPLPRRNDASVRYRLRNISDVLQEMGGATLTAFPPAAKTGRLVRERLRRLLSGHTGLQDLQTLDPTPAGHEGGDAAGDAIRALADLELHIEELSHQASGMGHNNPPEPVLDTGIDPAAFAQALEDIRALKAQMAVKPDAAVATPRLNRLTMLGVKIAGWWGQRGTKLADEALKLLVLPMIVAAVAAVARAIGGG